MRRHPLVRIVLALFGLLLIGLFSVVAVAIGVVVFAAILLRRALSGSKGQAQPIRREQGTAPANAGVIEGEYRVITQGNSRWTSPTS